MAHLASCYARSLNCKIGNPVFQPHFYPLLQEKFVTFHNSDKCPSKSFSYWDDTLKILKGELEKRNIKIYQIGTDQDKRVEGVDEFYNFTTFKQSAYLIDKALAHFGIDSAPVHIASALNKPTLSIYAHTYASTCSPLWNKDKAICLESHRNGNKPSFSNHEDPKTIDLIKPEEIAESVFKLLNIRNYTSQKTIFIGKKYLSKIIDIIPSVNPSNVNVNDAKVRIRMDLCFNLEVLQTILNNTQGQIEIITRKPLKKEFIEPFKSKISKIIYDAETFSKKFLEFLRSSGLEFELNCLDEKRLSEQRLKFFHFDIRLSEKEKEAKELFEKYKDLPQELQVYSGRMYVEGENAFSTIARNQNDFKFWVDAKYFRVFIETSKSV